MVDHAKLSRASNSSFHSRNRVWDDSLPALIIAFNKPFGVLSQFTPDGSPNRTLAEFAFPPRVYPLGRLDADSEGLLLLSDEGALNQRLLDPSEGHSREYWVQVEGVPNEAAMARLASGVEIQGRRTRPCTVRLLDPAPVLPPRNPPIRFRKTVPDAWLAIALIEGKNRQVRRMTAAVGHPTLRLWRAKIGGLSLGDLAPGRWRVLSDQERMLIPGASVEGRAAPARNAAGRPRHSSKPFRRS
jgi:23S rRNA pseudouridine2457 synthase